MGWGDPFKAAWRSATNAARKTAAKIANGAQSAADWTSEKAKQVKDWTVETSKAVKDWTVEKATQAKDWTVEKATQAKDWTVEKATQAKDWTVEKAVQAKNLAVDAGTAAARGAERGLAKGGLAAAGAINRAANALGNLKESAAKKVNSAYNRVREMFGLEPVGQGCATCPGPAEPQTDKEADGYYMGEGCKPKKDLASAKEAPVAPDPDNPCCNAKPPNNKTIFYVNGITTTRATHCETLREIANSTCAKVVGIYNATEGFFFDGLQTGGDRQLINRAANGTPPRLDGRNPAVNTVSDTVYSEVSQGRDVEIWAHSQGGAVTSLGLYSANSRLAADGQPNAMQGKVKVTSMGSAAPRWVDGPEYEHYVHANDITPVSLGLGADKDAALERAGQNANVHIFSGNQANGWPEAGQPGYDEGLLTPTSNHGVTDTYIAKRDKTHNGCGQKNKAYQEAKKARQAAQQSAPATQ